MITLRQSWMNILVNDKKRPMTLAINSTMLCSGFTIGPIIVKFIGAGDYLVFVSSSFFALLSCALLFLIRNNQIELTNLKKKLSIWTVIKNNQNMFFSRFLLDFQCAAAIIFTVIYGVKKGLTPENAGILVSAFMGISVLDFLIGFLIRKHPKKSYIDIGFFGCLFVLNYLSFQKNF